MPARKKSIRSKKVLKSPRFKGSLWFKEEGIVEKAAPATEEEAATGTTGIDPRLRAMARELRDRWSECAQRIVPPPAAA